MAPPPPEPSGDLLARMWEVLAVIAAFVAGLIPKAWPWIKKVLARVITPSEKPSSAHPAPVSVALHQPANGMGELRAHIATEREERLKAELKSYFAEILTKAADRNAGVTRESAAQITTAIATLKEEMRLTRASRDRLSKLITRLEKILPKPEGK